MLVEYGFCRITAGGGEWTFAPSLSRIAALGGPAEIVDFYAELFDESLAVRAARYVLATLCEQEDATPLIGWLCADDGSEHAGLMPAGDMVIIARHLMRHGIVGNGKGGGRRVSEFHAGEFISAARVHLGLSAADAESLSLTELQALFECKFPGQTAADVPSIEEYEAGMIAMQAIQKAALEKRGV